MRLLALDTSGRACSIALFEDSRVVRSRHELIGRGQAERIIPWIADLLGGDRVDHILVGCGPGSFTGVRIGIAAARALGLGWGIGVSGMDSLALIACAAPGTGPVAVAIEGGHGEIFIRAFLRDPLIAEGNLQSLAPERAADLFDQPLVIGSGAQRLIDLRGSGEAQTGEPDAQRALLLPEAMRSLLPTPIYGRLPDAKVPA